MKIEMFFKSILSYSDWTDFKKFCIFRRIKVCQHNSKSPITNTLERWFSTSSTSKTIEGQFSSSSTIDTMWVFIFYIYGFSLKKVLLYVTFRKTILYGFPIFRERTVIPNRNINVSFSCVWIYVCLTDKKYFFLFYSLIIQLLFKLLDTNPFSPFLF